MLFTIFTSGGTFMIPNILLNSVPVTTGEFSESNWNDLTDRMALLFNFAEEKKALFKNNRLARLIGAIPFLAGCDQPIRTALSNLTVTYLASHEAGKDVFTHNFSDNESLMKRLEPISHFPNGNPIIADRGMKLLAVIMLSDHNKDKVLDEENGKYNPVSSSIWNYEELIKKLGDQILAVDCPQMDEIISFHEAKASWWEYR